MKEFDFGIIPYPSKERKLILELSAKKDRLDNETFLMERLKVGFTEPILEQKGQYFDVQPGKRDKKIHLDGHCYANAFYMMREGFCYVEGLVTNEYGSLLSHAWNVDAEGNHFDFSVNENHLLTYWGIILPEELVQDVGNENGEISYCILPFIEIVEY